MTRLALPPLYAIVDPLDTGRTPEDLAAALLAGGARLLQLRLKTAGSARSARGRPGAPDPDRARRRPAADQRPARTWRARRRRTACTSARTTCRWRPPAQSSVRVALVGVSTHDVEQARAAAGAGADYLGVGPVFTTTTKVGALPARGLDLVRAVRAAVTLPLVGIGGITPDTAAAVRAAGADAVAMIGALIRAPDVAAAVRDTLARLGAS